MTLSSLLPRTKRSQQAPLASSSPSAASSMSASHQSDESSVSSLWQSHRSHQPALSLQPTPARPSSSSSSSSSPFSSRPSPSSSISSARRLIILAKHLPIRVTMSDKVPSTVEWEDSRSFLANLRHMRSPSLTVHFVGLAPPEFMTASAEVVKAYQSICLQHECTALVMSPELHNSYLNGFCKEILWPMLHYVMPEPSDGFGQHWPGVWRAYVEANEQWCETVCSLMHAPNDSVWIHNYHLLMLPGLVRRKFPYAKIGLFIHTPFPSSDIFRALPSRVQILESIMANDLIGFQTFDYARHFLSCIKRVLDLDFETLPGGALGVKYSGRFVSVAISHVGIASSVIKEISRKSTTLERVKELRQRFPGRRLLIGVDDLDAVKGPLLKIQAVERFLSKFPDQVQLVVFVEILFLSKNYSDTLGIQRDLLAEIDRVQKRFGSQVIHVVQPSEYMRIDEQVAWYRASHVAVVSSFWDGLNLLPYEYTASQDNNDPGALIISEFMGCSRSLNGVLRVNPWSLETVADSIERALSLNIDERKAMHARRYTYVMNHTIERWANGFLDQLDRASSMAEHLHFFIQGSGSNSRLVGLRDDFEHLDEKDILRSYQRCRKRIIFLDYDGTLVRSEKKRTGSHRAKNKPPPTILRLLTRLTEDVNNCVFLMTGRPRTTLHDWFGHIPELGLAAEKGLFLRWPKRLESACRMIWANIDAIAEDDDDEPGDISVPPLQSSTTEQDTALPGFGSPSNVSLFAEQQPIKLAFVPHIKSASLKDADWEHLVSLEDVSWKNLALEVIRSYTDQTDGAYIEDKEFSIIWHYELCDEEYGKLQATDLHNHLTKILKNPSVDVVKYEYSHIIEVKPHGVSKGSAAIAICEALLNSRDRERMLIGQQQQAQQQWLRASKMPQHNNQPFPWNTHAPFASHGPADAPVFLLSIGDDRGDEDMFIAMQRQDYLQEKSRLLRLGEQMGLKRTATSIDMADSRLRRAATPSWSSGGDGNNCEIFTVCVGQKQSSAHYYVDSDRAVVHMLQMLSDSSSHINSGTTSPTSAENRNDDTVLRKRKAHGYHSVEATH